MIFYVFRALQKSTSIPVHLSVSKTNAIGLPFSLRPHHNPSAAASNGGHQTGLEIIFYVKSKVSLLGVYSLWGDCKFIPAD